LSFPSAPAIFISFLQGKVGELPPYAPGFQNRQHTSALSAGTKLSIEYLPVSRVVTEMSRHYFHLKIIQPMVKGEIILCIAKAICG
jgi:hypothetical protein